MRPAPGNGAPEAEPLDTRRMRRRRGRISCVIGALLGLAGLLAGRLGALWIQFDVFAQFTIQFGIILLACVIGAMMPRARGIAALAVILMGLIGVGLWAHTASRDADTGEAAAQTGQTGQRLKIMSFNASLRNFDVEAVAAEIERNNPDIVVLIESGTEKRRVFERLRDRFPQQVNCLEIEYCDMAVLAKAPIASNEARVLWRGPPMIRVTFGGELSGLTVIGVHTTRFPYQHAQLIQLIELVKFIEKSPGERIVMGDFNSTPYSRLLNTFAQNSGFRRLTYLPSWPATFQLPQLDIDHIFVSPGLVPIGRAHIGHSAGSDHYPVIASILLPRP